MLSLQMIPMGLHQLQMAPLVPDTSLLCFPWLYKKFSFFQTRHFSSGMSTSIYRYVYVWLILTGSIPGGWCSASSPAAATAAAVATFSADVSQPLGIIDVSVVRLRRSDGDASATLDRESVGDERGRLPTGPQRRDPARRRAQEDQLGQRPIRAEILTQRRDDFPPSSIFQMISNVLLRPRSEWWNLLK